MPNRFQYGQEYNCVGKALYKQGAFALLRKT